MTHGIVVSCNAYFAQLGVRVGPQAIADTAAMFQIAAAEPATPAELRKALPFASYGQGEVLASPLRMAVVAGTIAAGGIIPQPTWIDDRPRRRHARRASKQAASKQAASKQAEPKQAETKQAAAKHAAPKQAVRVIDKRLAASLAGAMRQVVTSGTGRSLSNAVMPVAGKTGTAQVDGAASHSWFVGFAPFDESAADGASGSEQQEDRVRGRPGKCRLRRARHAGGGRSRARGEGTGHRPLRDRYRTRLSWLISANSHAGWNRDSDACSARSLAIRPSRSNWSPASSATSSIASSRLAAAIAAFRTPPSASPCSP